MNVLIVISFILSLVALTGVCLVFYYMKQIEQKLLEQFTNAYNLETKFRRIVNDHANIF